MCIKNEQKGSPISKQQIERRAGRKRTTVQDEAASVYDYSSLLMLSAIRNASAEIVNEGLTPNAVGMIDPSAM